MENNQRNSRKRLNSLILLVAFTAVMLIVSTYAWFSTQRNVTFTGLKGEVNVAEGLQISLDGERWFNAIDFGDFKVDTTTGSATYGSMILKDDATARYIADGKTFQAPATNVTNVVPTEYLPVSTTGGTSIEDKNNSDDGIGKTAVKFYSGEVTNFNQLNGIDQVTEDADGGFFAFDLFLMNSSGSGVVTDKIQLDPTSTVIGDVTTTGVQNTARVGFVLYENVNDQGSGVYFPYNTASGDAQKGKDMTIHSANQLTPAQIITQTTSYNVEDVAIWEPNADDHVSTIVNSFVDQMSWPTAYTYSTLASLAVDSYNDLTDGDQFPTFALTAASKTAKYVTGKDASDQDVYSNAGSIKNIYNWTAAAIEVSKLEEQITTQTAAETVRGTSIDLVSIDETTRKKADASAKELANGAETETAVDCAFDVEANQYHRLRIYVWMEGQDPDCINYASLGGGLTLNLGFSKPSTTVPS